MKTYMHLGLQSDTLIKLQPLVCADLLYYCLPVTPLALISCLYFQQSILTEVDTVDYVFVYDPR